MRSYLGEADVQPLADLFNAAEAVDHLGQGESVAGVQNWLSNPLLDVDRDFRVWEDANHRLIGVADLFSTTMSADEVAVWFRFRVHPEARRGEVGLLILDWASQQMRTMGQQRGIRARMTTPVRTHEVWRTTLLEDNGFAMTYHELAMSRPLSSPIGPRHPAGVVTLRPVEGPDEVASWVVLVNEANHDIHNPYPVTIDGRRQELRHSAYVSALDLVAVTPGGTFAAFCWCSIADLHAGWVRRLGVRPIYRNHGLGRFLLLAGLRQLQVHGAEVANLHVDARNAPVLGLSTTLGFQVTDDVKHFTKYV